jgi:hypothetical protein
MNKLLGDGEPSKQSPKMNRQRLAPLEREPIWDEIDKRAANVRTNMARLRALRLAKEAQEVGTEMSVEKAKPKPRFR